MVQRWWACQCAALHTVFVHGTDESRNTAAAAATRSPHHPAEKKKKQQGQRRCAVCCVGFLIVIIYCPTYVGNRCCCSRQERVVIQQRMDQCIKTHFFSHPKRVCQTSLASCLWAMVITRNISKKIQTMFVFWGLTPIDPSMFDQYYIYYFDYFFFP